jgi:hypothetical protein
VTRVEQRVQAGIAWLDENVGPAWVDRIDARTLDLADYKACVCGQVFRREGGYRYAVALINRDEPSAFRKYFRRGVVDHGFCCATPRGYRALQAAWLEALAPVVKPAEGSRPRIPRPMVGWV